MLALLSLPECKLGCGMAHCVSAQVCDASMCMYFAPFPSGAISADDGGLHGVGVGGVGGACECGESV